MARLVFDGSEDPVASVRALATTLALWLREAGPPTDPVAPATVRFTYTDGGALESVTVILDGEP